MRFISDSLKPLSDIRKGDGGILEVMQAGRGLACRLTALGLTPGATVEMIQNYGHGPLIVNVRGTHVALSRGMARHLLIKQDESR